MRHPVIHLVQRVWALSAVRYLVVGGFAFAFDVALLWLLHEAGRLPVAPSTAVSFLLAFAVTFLLQRALTFRSSAGFAGSAVRYTLLVLANTVAVTAIVAGSEAIGWGWLVGKVIAVAATTVWNYFAYRSWVFAVPRPHPDL